MRILQQCRNGFPCSATREAGQLNFKSDIEKVNLEDGEVMSYSKAGNDFWTTEELQRRVSLYQNSQGRFDPTKIHVATGADVFFIVCIAAVLVIFAVDFLIFASLGELWSSNHILSLAMLEIYPLFGAFVISLYVLGHRWDETLKYFRYKKILKSRSEGSHEPIEQPA